MGLLEDFKRHESESFVEIHNSYFNQLVIFASKIIKNRPVSEEIVSDSFIKLFKDIKKFKELSGIRSFLYLVTRNACFNYLRNMQTLRAKKKEWIINLGNEDFLEINQVEGELLKDIYLAIDKLPNKSGMVIKMYLAGKDTGEIAERLQISTLTVRSQKRYAIKLLKAVFIG